MPAGPAAPDDAAAISALARSHAHAALQVLVEALDSPDPGERVAAAVALLNAGYGQPVQPIALDSLHGITVEVHANEPPGSRPNGEGSSAWSARLRERQS
jgi:HEAT repeat protein